MSAPQALGLTKGPGETPHEFTFVSPDPSEELRAGEFVAYRAEVDGEERQILARVTNRRPLRLYPDAFLARPDVDPDRVAAAMGYDHPGRQLFELTATVIGYYDKTLGDFINPRLPPRSGRPIYLASDEELGRVLSKRQAGETGAAHVGSLLSRGPGRVPVVLDLRAITSTHLAIIASTGAGKSYLAAVLLEEMMKPANRAAVLIVDPHGEYDTLAEMANDEAFAAPAAPGEFQASYRPEVKIFRPGEVKVRVSALNEGDLRYLLPNLSERMEWALHLALQDVRRNSRQEKGESDRWTLDELELRLNQLAEGSGEGDQPGDQFAGTAGAVLWRLDNVLRRSVIFDNFQHLNLQELLRPGRCSVLQLNEVDDKEQQVMVATLLRRLFQARLDTTRGRASTGDELHLPYPAFVLIEEGHRFAPAGSEAVSKGVLKRVLAEGRKFGLAVGLISQRPGTLDGDVLSQCNTQFILRIVNPVDQARVAESVETVGRDLLDELPALTKGQAIIAGEAVNTPLLCRVRARHTRHGAESRDAPALWRQYFRDEQQSRRDRERALPPDTPRPRDKPRWEK